MVAVKARIRIRIRIRVRVRVASRMKVAATTKLRMRRGDWSLFLSPHQLGLTVRVSGSIWSLDKTTGQEGSFEAF